MHDIIKWFKKWVDNDLLVPSSDATKYVMEDRLQDTHKVCNENLVEDAQHFLHAQYIRTIFLDLGWPIYRDNVFY